MNQPSHWHFYECDGKKSLMMPILSRFLPLYMHNPKEQVKPILLIGGTRMMPQIITSMLPLLPLILPRLTSVQPGMIIPPSLSCYYLQNLNPYVPDLVQCLPFYQIEIKNPLVNFTFQLLHTREAPFRTISKLLAMSEIYTFLKSFLATIQEASLNLETVVTSYLELLMESTLLFVSLHKNH